MYAEPVAEHALALRSPASATCGRYARAADVDAPGGRNLLGARVTILGGGGITEACCACSRPFGCDVTVVRRTPAPMDGRDRVVGPDRHLRRPRGAPTLVVLALRSRPRPTGILGRAGSSCWSRTPGSINVARGAHIVTDDLVAVLAEGRIGGAALDVTDPEPLPDGHPLWSRAACIITPHTANTIAMAGPLLGAAGDRERARGARRGAAAGPGRPRPPATSGSTARSGSGRSAS